MRRCTTTSLRNASIDRPGRRAGGRARGLDVVADLGELAGEACRRPPRSFTPATSDGAWAGERPVDAADLEHEYRVAPSATARRLDRKDEPAVDECSTRPV